VGECKPKENINSMANIMHFQTSQSQQVLRKVTNGKACSNTLVVSLVEHKSFASTATTHDDVREEVHDTMKWG
jgi:hypothetical protein